MLAPLARAPPPPPPPTPACRLLLPSLPCSPCLTQDTSCADHFCCSDLSCVRTDDGNRTCATLPNPPSDVFIGSKWAAAAACAACGCRGRPVMVACDDACCSSGAWCASLAEAKPALPLRSRCPPRSTDPAAALGWTFSSPRPSSLAARACVSGCAAAAPALPAQLPYGLRPASAPSLGRSSERPSVAC
jgi:hypothetical protein